MTIIKRNFILKILSFFFVASAWVAAEDSFQAKMYGVESGILKSEIAVGYPGDKTIIHETLYWDNWGLKITKYQIPESGKGGTKNIINYIYEAGKIRPGKMVLVKLDDMSTKETLTPASRVMSSLTREDLNHVSLSLMAASGSKKTGETRSWLGKTCDIWLNHTGAINCLWQGLIMHTKISVVGGMESIKTPTHVYTGAVDPVHFTVPGPQRPDLSK